MAAALDSNITSTKITLNNGTQMPAVGRKLYFTLY